MGNTQIRPDFVIRLLMGVLFVVIIFIVFAGLNPPVVEEPAVSASQLEQRLAALTNTLEQRSFPVEKDAEQRAIDLFRIAQENEVEVTSWNNKAAREPFGGSPAVDLMRTSVEIRGEREGLLATLDSIESFFATDFVITNMEFRGAEQSWLMRFSIVQLLEQV